MRFPGVSAAGTVGRVLVLLRPRTRGAGGTAGAHQGTSASCPPGQAPPSLAAAIPMAQPPGSGLPEVLLEVASAWT